MSRHFETQQMKIFAFLALIAVPVLLMGILSLSSQLSSATAALLLGFSMAALGFGAWFLPRVSSGNSSSTVEFIAEVKNGGLPTDSFFPNYSANGEVQQALVQMTSGLRLQRDTKEKEAQTLINAMRDSGSMVGRMERGSNLIAKSSEALSQGASTQAAAIEEVSSSLTVLENQTRSNAENASTANKLTEEARLAGEHGDSQMQEMIVAMTAINDSSQEISKIIKTIDEIAFQTNLLALNAAVEAARAGKHGKGFAVVAEEVRSLAARSSKAAGETSKMIQESHNKVNHGNDIANSTGKALNEIVQTISQASSLVNEITVASQDQALGLQEITTGMTKIEEVTMNNAAAAESNAASARQLSNQSANLKGLIGQHTVIDEGDGSGSASLIEWSDDFSVQVPEIDAQHKQLVDIINDLGSAMALGQSHSAMKSILGRLGEYAVDHFAFEENLIRQAGYPDLEGHIKVHKSLLKKFGEIAEEFDGGNPMASAQTLAFLQDWLLNHIQKVDKKYTSCVLSSRQMVT